MKWEEYLKGAEEVLRSPRLPSSLEIISLIKKINPTRLTLSETDRERGYHVKNRLQSLLLEHYSDTFHLVPHPTRPNIILIKHRALPSIDACHADFSSLSRKAVEMVEKGAELSTGSKDRRRNASRGRRAKGPTLSPKEALKEAQARLHEYDHAAAEAALAGIRAGSSGDVRIVARAASLLLYEMGAYQRCVNFLLSQPRHVLKDRTVRELLAVAYHSNGSFPEARAILEELHPAELGKGALFAYADIAFKDGNLPSAFRLAKMAEGKEGFVPGLAGLTKEIEAAMSAQADPLEVKARGAFQAGLFEECRRLAREALDLYPNCHSARQLLTAIEGIDHAAEVAGLWARLEKTQSGERRLALLTALLERDKEEAAKIKSLIGEEKERQRRMLFDERLESLRALVLQSCWPECFDVILLLSRQPEFRERVQEVLSLSPFFPVLHENKRLHSAPERSAKDLWLRFVKVKADLAAGNDEGCWEAMKELKPWFNGCREFDEEYLVLLRREQDKAREQIASLLDQSEAPQCPLAEVRRIFACVRKEMSVLPLEERRDLARTMERCLDQLAPKQAPRAPLDAYREALQIGNRDKASYLREEIGDSAALRAIEAQVAGAFPITFEPLSLQISDELPIDLVTPPPLRLYGFTDRGFLLEDGDDTLIMIDFVARSACRMTSAVFAKATICDVTEKGVFVFVEKKGAEQYGPGVWRAELTHERASFLGNFDLREWFEVEEGSSLAAIFASSERETDYYVVIKRDDGRGPAKVMKKRLAPKATLESVQLGDLAELKIWRWSSAPDSFLVVGQGQMRHLNRNLALKARLREPPDLYMLDRRHGHVCGLENYRVTVRDSSLNLIRSYERSFSFGLFTPERCHGLSIETKTALMVLGDGKQTFYNLSNNKFSSKIRVGRVIPSVVDGRWYCFDYSGSEAKLWLRDITQEIHTMLRWEEFFRPRQGKKKMQKAMMWFHDDENFVYKPEEW